MRGPVALTDQPMGLASAIIISFFALEDAAAALPADVVALQETRLKDWVQGEMRTRMKALGWNLLCG